MIYLDTSVALAQLLAEDRTPPASLWREPLVSSRLLEYELWTRVHARGLGRSHGEDVRQLLGRIALPRLTTEVRQTSVASRHEWSHAEFFGERQALSIARGRDRYISGLRS